LAQLGAAGIVLRLRERAMQYLVELTFEGKKNGVDYQIFDSRPAAEKRYQTAVKTRRVGAFLSSDPDIIIRSCRLFETKAPTLPEARRMAETGAAKLLYADPPEFRVSEDDLQEMLALIHELKTAD